MKKLLITIYLLACNTAVYAAAFAKAKSGLTSLEADLLSLVKILAVIALIVAGGFYMKGLSSLKTFVQIAVGCVIAGSAAEIVSYFF
jgi:type IV secretory pathway VirB2 component (pilin)